MKDAWDSGEGVYLQRQGFRVFTIKESLIEPGELYMNTINTLVNENSAKTGLTITLCQSRLLSA